MRKLGLVLTILFSLIIAGCQNNLSTDKTNAEDENRIPINENRELSPDKIHSAYISSEGENVVNSLSIYNSTTDETKIYSEDFKIPIIPNIVKWLDNEYLLISAEYGTIERKKNLYLFDTIAEAYYFVDAIGDYREVTGIQISEDIITIDYAKLDTEYKQYGDEKEVYTYSDILEMARVNPYEKIFDFNQQASLFYGGRNSIFIKQNGENKILGRDFSSYPEISPDKGRIVYIDPNEQDLPRALYIYDLKKDTQKIILETDEKGVNTPKVVKWLDDKYLIMIVGYAYGTVNLGGELYIYDLENETLLLALTPEENTEFRDISTDGDLITLDVARWTDTNMSEYIIEKREISYKELLADSRIKSTE